MERNDPTANDDTAGPFARERERLSALSTLTSWSVRDGEPDIRGWEIRTISGRMLGAVADLLVDADAGEIVLLDVDLAASDRHTFVPIRVVHIDRARRVVLMDSADLPEANLARATRSGTSGRRVADIGVVRYPASDRDVTANRVIASDSAARPLWATRDPSASEQIAERRRGDRRRIDRISTDL